MPVAADEEGRSGSAPVVVLRAGSSERGQGRGFTVVGRATGMPTHAIALVSFGDDLAGVGILEKGAAVAKVRSLLKIGDLEQIEPELPLEVLRGAMPNQFRRHVDYRALPERTSTEVLAALETLRPELARPLAVLRGRIRRQVFSGPGYRAVAEERDAVGLALSFRGMEREVLRMRRAGDRPTRFVQGLRQAMSGDADPPGHHLGVFDDWDLIRSSAVGATRLEKNGSAVTFVTVSRTPIEEVRGVDLVYHHEEYRSFVVIRYQRLEGDAEALRRDLELMRGLGPRVCFLKLYLPTEPEADSDKLMVGRYVPLDYLDSYGAKVPGHLSNPQFIDLVKAAWVGATGGLDEDLRRVVEALVAAGRTVILASAGSGR